MDDLKLYGRNVNEIDSLIQTVRIFSQDIGMEFGIQKCAMLKIVRRKMVECEGISLQDGEKVRSLEKGQDYRYLQSWTKVMRRQSILTFSRIQSAPSPRINVVLGQNASIVTNMYS